MPPHRVGVIPSNATLQVLRGLAFATSAFSGGYLWIQRQRRLEFLTRIRDNARHLQTLPNYNPAGKDYWKSLLEEGLDDDTVGFPRRQPHKDTLPRQYSAHVQNPADGNVNSTHRKKLRFTPSSKGIQNYTKRRPDYTSSDRKGGASAQAEDLAEGAETPQKRHLMVFHRSKKGPLDMALPLDWERPAKMSGTLQSERAAPRSGLQQVQPLSNINTVVKGSRAKALYISLGTTGRYEELAQLLRSMQLDEESLQVELRRLFWVLRDWGLSDSMVKVYEYLETKFNCISVAIPVIRLCVHLEQMDRAKAILERAVKQSGHNFPRAMYLILRTEWAQFGSFSSALKTHRWLHSIIRGDDPRLRNRLTFAMILICMQAHQFDYIYDLVDRLAGLSPPAQQCAKEICFHLVQQDGCQINSRLSVLDQLWEEEGWDPEEFGILLNLVFRKRADTVNKYQKFDMLLSFVDFRSFTPTKELFFGGIHSALAVSARTLSFWLQLISDTFQRVLTVRDIDSIFLPFRLNFNPNWSHILRAKQGLLACQENLVSAECKQSVRYLVEQLQRNKIENPGKAIPVSPSLRMQQYMAANRPDLVLSIFEEGRQRGSKMSLRCVEMAMKAVQIMSIYSCRVISSVDDIMAYGRAQGMDPNELAALYRINESRTIQNQNIISSKVLEEAYESITTSGLAKTYVFETTKRVMAVAKAEVASDFLQAIPKSKTSNAVLTNKVYAYASAGNISDMQAAVDAYLDQGSSVDGKLESALRAAEWRFWHKIQSFDSNSNFTREEAESNHIKVKALREKVTAKRKSNRMD
ncbi:MAG: hypothetical protein M1814_005179 [Vezdaea aestivalis]|nr:MAG: hypothetical protein M1814_005179 [Vezdaea aestivalis]